MRVLMLWLRTSEGRPLWGRAVYITLHGARLSSVPSGDRSANPASVPGRIGLRRALLSVTARKRSGAKRLATSWEVSRAASSAVSCRCAASGHRANCSDDTRDQSREADSLSRLFGSVKTTAKCVSVGPAHCSERPQNPVRFSSASIQRGFFHPGGPRAGSGNGTEVDTLRGRRPLRWSLLPLQSPGPTAGTSLFRGRMRCCVLF